ncbi:MAG: hypothetical protein AAGH76_00150 [Pseudomonadota bacterium]
MFVVPLIIAMYFGPYAGIAAPILLVITAVTALPLLLLLRHLQKLDWWHAVIAGAACSLTAAYVYFSVGNPGHTAFAGPSNTALFLFLGVSGAAAFWWLGVFRNEAFPFVSTKVPYRMAIMVPIVLGLAIYHRVVSPTEGPVGCVVALHDPARRTAWRYALIDVQFADGGRDRLWLTQGYAQRNVVGRCLNSWQRPSVTLTGTRYLFASFYEGQCGIDC